MTLVVPIGHSQHEGAQILKRIAKVPIQPPPPVRPSWSIPRRLIYGLFCGVHEPPHRVHLLPQRRPLAASNSRATSVLAGANCFGHLPQPRAARPGRHARRVMRVGPAPFPAPSLSQGEAFWSPSSPTQLPHFVLLRRSSPLSSGCGGSILGLFRFPGDDTNQAIMKA